MEECITRHMDVSAERVLTVLTDIAGLPRWNSAITQAVDIPDDLVVGAQWVVELAALGQRWHSRSTVLELERETGVFAYRSCTDDGNPSYAEWRWQVTPRASGCEVVVAWSLHPATFWRRVLLAKVRQRQLAHSEVPRSLAALEQECRTAVA